MVHLWKCDIRYLPVAPIGRISSAVALAMSGIGEDLD